MITPADIQNKEFAKGFRGYDEEEVDMFLDLITLDLEKLIKENINLKAQVATLKKEQGSIGGTDLTVKDTLETAKKIMDDLAVSSEKRANALLSNAEMDAAIIIKDAKIKAEQVAENSAALTKSFERFKKEYRALLDRSMRELDAMSENIDIDGLAVLLEERKQYKTENVTESPAISKMVEKSDSDADIADDMKKTMVNIRYE